VADGCNRCGGELDGRHSRQRTLCKRCLSADHKKWRDKNPERNRAHGRKGYIKYQYGLTVEEYDVLIASGCAICGSDGKGDGGIHLDHCHSSGKIRGTLCGNCNRGLGNFKDNPLRLRRAAGYLEASSDLTPTQRTVQPDVLGGSPHPIAQGEV
jgi:hypothetical protein